MPDLEPWPTTFRAWRARRWPSAWAAARELGVCPTSWRRWERGDRWPSGAAWARLRTRSGALGIDAPPRDPPTFAEQETRESIRLEAMARTLRNGGTSEIGRALRAARVRAGLLLGELAVRAAISLPYLSEIERGRRPATHGVVALYRQHCGYDGPDQPRRHRAPGPRTRTGRFRLDLTRALAALGDRTDTGADLARRRIALGLSAGQLERRAHVPRGSVRKVEGGIPKRAHRAEWWARIEVALRA